MIIYKKGLLIGRFQPFHKGHLYLLQHVQKKVDKLVIGIGSANVFDENNPFTYEDRKKMIEQIIKQEKLESFVEKIIPLNDFYDDELWFQDTLRVTGGRFDIVIGNNEWSNRIFETRGYSILRAGFFKRYLYEGEKIRELMHQKKQWFNRVPEYIVPSIQSIFKKHKKIPYRFQHIAIGGTFDHFHKGHKVLIDTALKYGNHLSIGISASEMYKNKDFISTIESFEERKKSVIEYLIKNKSLKRVTFFPLSDIYGSTKNDGTIEAIVVSKSTYQNAIKINHLRSERKLPELKIICIKDVKGNDGQLISSERIRKGEIDRNGFDYLTVFKKNLELPEYLREELRKPLGKVIRGNENEIEKTVNKVITFIKLIKPVMVIAVGDIIADSLEKAGFIPDIKIIDYRSRRKKITNYQLPITNKNSNFKFQISKNITNSPGTISKKAVQGIKMAINAFLEPSHPKGVQAQKIKKSQTIVITGEEDLLALPAILLAPLGSIVLYGQIDLGVVIVEVDEKMKKRIKRILKKFI